MKRKVLTLIICFMLLASLLPQTVVFALSDGVYKYSIKNNTVIIEGVVDKPSFIGEQVIPYTINGYDVREIGKDAFADCNQLESITIPFVTNIEKTAFDGCNNLKIIGYAGGCAEDFAIDMGFSFEPIVCSNNITFDTTSVSLSVGDSYSIVATIYPNDAVYKNLVWLTNDENVAKVDENGVITAVGKGVTNIGAHTEDGRAFAECDVYVDAIAGGECGDYTVPGGSMGDCKWVIGLDGTLVISGEGRMIQYEIPPWKKYIDNVDKIIIESGIKNIPRYAFKEFTKLKEVEIATSVIEIKDYAFAGCESLTNIILPNSITEITYDVFRNCNGLKSITIPKSVTKIKHYAFYNCASLADVYYKGTREEWNAIEIAYGNDSLVNATIHCSDESFVLVTGIGLNEEQLELNVGEKVKLQYNVSPVNATNKNILWSSSDTSVATVENGDVLAVGVGNAMITATTEDGGYSAECKVTVLDTPISYSFGQSVQIGLIEPWFLKANARVYTDENPTNIDYSELVDYGAYFIRARALADETATQESLTVEDIINNPASTKYSKSEGTATVDGSYITANYDKGLYTYELDDSVFVLFFIEDANGITYAPIRERNLKALLEARCNDTTNFPNELEREVYKKMLDIFEAISEYREDYFSKN